MNPENQARNGAPGYAMAALLVILGVMAVLLSVAMPAWRQMVQREKEEELIFRGQQYVRAIGLFQRKYAASFPPNVETLVEQRFLRKPYKDPMVADGQFQVLFQMSAQTPGQQAGRGTFPGTSAAPTGSQASGRGTSGVGAGTLGPRGGVIGVASKSTETSIKLYNGRNHYNEWQFVFAPSLMPGQGQGRPGMGGRGGRGTPGVGPGGQRPFGSGGTPPGGFGPRPRGGGQGPR